jgi:hypothetical protein
LRLSSTDSSTIATRDVPLVLPINNHVGVKRTHQRIGGHLFTRTWRPDHAFGSGSVIGVQLLRCEQTGKTVPTTAIHRRLNRRAPLSPSTAAQLQHASMITILRGSFDLGFASNSASRNHVAITICGLSHMPSSPQQLFQRSDGQLSVCGQWTLLRISMAPIRIQLRRKLPQFSHFCVRF